MNQEENILDELLSDPRFQEWVTTGDHNDHWTKWMAEHPQNKEVLDDAIAIIRGLPVRRVDVSGKEIERSFQELETRAKLGSGNQMKPIWRIRRWLPYAAAIIALLLAVWIWDSNGSDIPLIEMSVITAPGEQKDFTLPDSSSVVLNGNSSLQYLYDPNSGERQVILDGEAHFNVRTKEGENGREPFVVKTPDVNVVVLGTVFSVISEDLWTTIVLEEGKVQLSEITDENLQVEGLVMKPGEKATYNRKEGIYTVEEIDAIEFNAWTHNQLSLVNRSAEEVVRWIKRNYNIQIHIPDQYKNSNLTGSVDLEDPATAIQVVALALGLEPVEINVNQWDFKQIKTNE